ncbi:MAG: biotin--[acetyl-CoA-carboxylase] ligase [Rubrivivax sp.]|nr:MAG: biotin--[acetyl-CoA-carboxylase] ligase [Rubrivivax sp.]
MDDGLSALNTAAERLWEALQADHPGLSFEVLPTVDSTNTHALQLGRLGVDTPTVVVAWQQTAGRGRAGRSWEARPGDSLTMSLALPLALTDVPGGGSALSLAVGLVVAEALEALLARLGVVPAPRIQLKWPNDLWVDDRKLGGILIEAVSGPSLPDPQRWVVIGLGLNLASTPADLETTRCDLRGLMPIDAPTLTAAQVFEALVPTLLHAVKAFQHTGFAPLLPRYAARDALRGRLVSLWRTTSGSPAPGHADNADANGRALGIDGSGALLIDDGSGQPRTWCVGEVSVRPAPPP